MRRWVRVALVLLLAGAARPVLVQAAGQGGGSAAGFGARPWRPDTVAVAPFENLSGDPGDAWLGAAIAETVATDLEQLSTLTVVSRDVSSHPLRGPGGEAAAPPSGLAAARGWSVAWLVTGDFERIGSEIRITARIVRAASGAARHTVEVNGPLDDLFALQDRVAAALRDGFAALAAAPAAIRPRAPRRPPAPAAGVAGAAAAPAGRDGDGTGPLRPPRRRGLGGVFGAASAPPEAAVPEVTAPATRPSAAEPLPDDAPEAFSPRSFPPALSQEPFLPTASVGRCPGRPRAGRRRAAVRYRRRRRHPDRPAHGAPAAHVRATHHRRPSRRRGLGTCGAHH